jgi:predicted DNA-binding transcriptional regulator AlpA
MSLATGTSDGRPTLLPVPSVLKEVPISRAFFYKLVKAGEGPVLTRLGDRVFVSRENLADWLTKREVRPEAHAA